MSSSYMLDPTIKEKAVPNMIIDTGMTTFEKNPLSTAKIMLKNESEGEMISTQLTLPPDASTNHDYNSN